MPATKITADPLVSLCLPPESARRVTVPMPELTSHTLRILLRVKNKARPRLPHRAPIAFTRTDVVFEITVRAQRLWLRPKKTEGPMARIRHIAIGTRDPEA